MAYRAGCDTCSDYNDVPDIPTAEQWESVHVALHPGHQTDSEFYPALTMPWTAQSPTPRP